MSIFEVSKVKRYSLKNQQTLKKPNRNSISLKTGIPYLEKPKQATELKKEI